MGFFEKLMGTEGTAGSLKDYTPEMRAIDDKLHDLEIAYGAATKDSPEAQQAFEAWDNHALERIEQLINDDPTGNLGGGLSKGVFGVICPPDGKAEKRLQELDPSFIAGPHNYL